jgi:small subunit ribosomal protein S6
MRRYETIYILRPTLSEDEVNEVVEGANSILTNDNGQIISLDKWGARTLAYLIQKETQGYFVYCDYATEPANVTEMERKFKIDESVMKYMTVKLADSIDSDGIDAARGEYEAAVVAAAEAEAEAEAAKEAEEQKESKPKVTEATKTSEDAKTSEATEATVESEEKSETKNEEKSD